MCAARARIAVGEYAPTLVKRLSSAPAARKGAGPRDGRAPAPRIEDRRPGRRRTRSRWQSPTRASSGERPPHRLPRATMTARLSEPRRNRCRHRRDRRRRRRLSGPRLHSHARLARPNRRRGPDPDRAPGARGRLDPVRFRLGARARLLPRPYFGPGRRRPPRARDPLDPLARRARLRGVARRQGDDRPRERRRPQARSARIANELLQARRSWPRCRRGPRRVMALAAAPSRRSPTSASSSPKRAPRQCSAGRARSTPASTRWSVWRAQGGPLAATTIRAPAVHLRDVKDVRRLEPVMRVMLTRFLLAASAAQSAAAELPADTPHHAGAIAAVSLAALTRPRRCRQARPTRRIS